jgi:hypothetical protein
MEMEVNAMGVKGFEWKWKWIRVGMEVNVMAMMSGFEWEWRDEPNGTFVCAEWCIRRGADGANKPTAVSSSVYDFVVPSLVLCVGMTSSDRADAMLARPQIYRYSAKTLTGEFYTEVSRRAVLWRCRGSPLARLRMHCAHTRVWRWFRVRALSTFPARIHMHMCH